MRYGHAMTAWTGLFHWLNNNGFTNGEKDFKKISKAYRQIMIDFMLHKGLKPKLARGKKVIPENIDANACAFKVQKVFKEFTEYCNSIKEISA